MEQYKKCNKCLLEKSLDMFYQNNRGGFSYRCKECDKNASKLWIENNRDKHNQYTRNSINTARKKVFSYYGYQCSCCKETNPLFLTIDHKNNDGAQHRKELKLSLRGGANFYRWIVRNNFPSFLQVLCYNCNCGKQRNKGVCPHFL